MVSERYVIEINDEAVGLVVGERPQRGVIFHAVHPQLFRIQGKHFPSAREALRKARAILSQADQQRS